MERRPEGDRPRIITPESGGPSAPPAKYEETLKIVIGEAQGEGVPFYNPGFAWVHQPGPYGAQSTLRVPDSHVAEVDAMRGGLDKPLIVSVSAPRAPNVKDKELLTLRNVWLLEGRPLNDIYWEFPIVNIWYWFKYFAWTKRYNMRREMNDLEALDSQGQFVFRKDNYRRYSTLGGLDGGEQRPWFALEMLNDVLSTIDRENGTDFWDESSIDNVPNNEYVVDDKEYIRVPANQVVDELTSLAYVGIRCDNHLDGKIRVFRKSVEAFAGMSSNTILENGLAHVPLAPTRPSVIDVGFTVLAEIWMSTDQEEDAAGATVSSPNSEDIYPYLFNCMPIPTNISAQAVQDGWGDLSAWEKKALGKFGENYKEQGVTRGTWLPLNVALVFRDAEDMIRSTDDPFKQPFIRLTETLQDRFPTSKVPAGNDEPIHTRGYYSSLLEIWYGTARLDDPEYQASPVILDPVRMAWVRAIRQHLYQTYRIWPDYIDSIVEWIPKRAGLVDLVYRSMMPSPVFTQYCLFPALLPAVEAIDLKQVTGTNKDDTDGLPTTLGKFFGRQSDLGKFVNPKVKAIIGADDDVTYSPFTISIIDQDLGVFRVTPMNDLEGIIGEITIAQVENLNKTLIDVNNDDVVINTDGTYLQGFMWLKSTKKLKTIISIVPATPNGDGQLYTLDKTPEEFGHPAGIAPRLKVISKREVCRVRVDQKIMNKELLDDIANAEVKTLLESYRDRTAGIVEYDGFATDAELVGFQNSIMFQAGGLGARTYQDYNETPEPPPFYTLVNHTTQKLLFRRIWAGR